MYPRKSTINQLKPFLDNDKYLRARGRIEWANLPYESRHPIIVPPGHLAYLLVHFQHYFLKHAGIGTILATLRNSLWIVRARQYARSIHKSCVRCQRHDSRHIVQPQAPLPELRVK